MRFHYFLILSSLLLSNACSLHTPPPTLVTPLEISTQLNNLGVQPTPYLVVVSTSDQTLTVLHHNQTQEVYTISTGRRGIGQRINTYKTPLGLHRINEKIGDQVPDYGIFFRRQFTGNTWEPIPQHLHKKDFISTRILRLEGLQPGFNRGQDEAGNIVDTEERAVYIHGTTMEWQLGSPSTKGCVHMSAKDIRDLFAKIPLGTLVWITPERLLSSS